MVIRWWIKYGSIKTDDPDFVQAKLAASYVGGGTFLFFLFLATKMLVLNFGGFEVRM